MTITLNDVREQIENGNHTAVEIADELGFARAYVNTVLGELVDEGELAREREGRSFQYYLPGTPESEGFPAGSDDLYQQYVAEREFSRPTPPNERGSLGGDDALKPDRSLYTWDAYVPDRDEIPRYLEAEDEYTRIKASVEGREVVGQPARILLGGPQGCGKTLVALNVAADNGWPAFILNAGDSVPSDLKGQAVMTRDNGTTVTRWADGVLTKALLSAAERPTLLLIDEVNRAPPEVKSPLFSALDFRGEIEVPFTGERVRANPLNLVVISTMNEGRQFHGLQPLDAAEVRRISRSGKFNVDYLGVNHPEKEAELVADSAPISKALAEEMVEVSNHVRRLARGDSEVRQGIPTSEVMGWARVAAVYEAADLERPVLRAAEDVILGGVYEHHGGEDRPEVAEVRTIISSKLKDAPADPVKFAKYAGLLPTEEGDDDVTPRSESNAFECADCGDSWATEQEAEDAGALADFTCPTCYDGDVVKAR